jgi:hypothetical protein
VPRACTICNHKDRQRIDSALAVSQPLRQIAPQFGCSVAALHRHKPHLIKIMAQVQQDKTEEIARSAWDRLQAAERDTDAVRTEARQRGHSTCCLQAAARTEKQVQLRVLISKESDRVKADLGITVAEPERPLDLAKLDETEEADLQRLLRKLAA